jgi:hypothetical protein
MGTAVLAAVVSSGVVAAIVSGIWNIVSDKRRDLRDDAAVRRQVRAAAVEVSKHVIMFRKFGFGNTEMLESALAYLRDLSKDRDVHRALTDESSASLAEAASLCDLFIGTYRSHNLDCGNAATPDERESKMMRASSAAKPTFDALRKYFKQDESASMVAEFDKAETEREGMERIRQGEFG